MPTITQFEDLQIWQLARVLSKELFQISNNEPFCKDFRFRDQIRAAAGSVMDNIAEGFERSGQFEFVNFLSIAKGSCGEVRSQLYRALDFNYITNDQFEDLAGRYRTLSEQIAGFIKYLNQSNIKGQKFKDRT